MAGLIPVYQQQVAAPTGGGPQLASNVNVQPVTAMAIQQAGQSISQAAGTFAQIQRANQHDSDAAWTSEVTSKAIQDFNQYSIQSQAQAKGPATGYADQVTKYVNDYKKNLIETAPNEQSKKFITESLNNVATHVITKAQNFEYEAYKGNTYNQLDSSRDVDSKTTAMFPDMGADLLKKQIGIIDGTNLPDVEKYKLKKKAQEEIFNAYTQNQSLNNTKNFYSQLGGALGVVHPEGTIQNKVANEAQANGIDALTALTIMGTESGKKSINAKNNESSAYGLFQFTDSTWKDYGGTEENRNDPDTQVKLGIQYLKDRQNELTVQLGHKPSATELKIGHMFRGNAVEILQSNPNTLIASIIGDKAAKANHMEGKTTGEVVMSLHKDVNNQMAKLFKGNQNKTDNFMINSATVEQVTQAFHQTHQVMQQKSAQEAFVIDQRMKDDQAKLMDGQPVQSLLTRENFTSVAPNNPAKADSLYNEYMDGIKTAQLYNQIKFSTAGETNNLRESFARDNDLNKPGYANRQKDLHILDTAIAHKQEALKSDPASYVMQSPLVQQKAAALQAAQTPEAQAAAKGDLYSSLIANQKNLGVVVPKLLTKSQADSTVQTIVNAPGEKLAGVLSNLEQQYGKYWPTVYGQLAQDKSFPSAALVIPNMSDINARVELGNLANIKIEDLKSQIEKSKVIEINNKMKNLLQDFNSSVSESTDNTRTLNAIQDSILRLTYSKVAKNSQTSSNAAVEQAYNQVLSQYKFEKNNISSKTMRIPAQYDSAAIKNATDLVVKSLTVKELQMPHQASQFENAEDIATAYERDLKGNYFGGSKTVWVTNEDETGLKLYFQGANGNFYKVKDKNGQQITKTFDELKKIDQQWKQAKGTTGEVPKIPDFLIPTPEQEDNLDGYEALISEWSR